VDTRYTIRTGACIVASAALHALVLAGLPGLFPAGPDTPPPLTARLVPVEAVVPPPSPPAAKPRPERRPTPPAAIPRVAAPEPAPRIEVPVQNAGEAVDVAEAPEAAASAPTAPVHPALPVIAQPPAPDTAPPRPVLARQLPRKGSIVYDAYLGAEKLGIGRTVQTWEIGDGRYRLTSLSQVTGFLALFVPYLYDFSSEGRLVATGLEPETFSMRRGRQGANRFEARFDWEAMSLSLGPYAAMRKVALPPGTQDMLSFLYQLTAADLAPGRIRISVTNGNRLEAYELDVGPAERVETPLGTLEAVPLRQVRQPERESLEMWIAPSLGYLPVRVRFRDRRGNVSGEQIATELRVDAD